MTAGRSLLAIMELTGYHWIPQERHKDTVFYFSMY